MFIDPRGTAPRVLCSNVIGYAESISDNATSVILHITGSDDSRNFAPVFMSTDRLLDKLGACASYATIEYLRALAFDQIDQFTGFQVTRQSYQACVEVEPEINKARDMINYDFLRAGAAMTRCIYGEVDRYELCSSNAVEFAGVNLLNEVVLCVNQHALINNFALACREADSPDAMSDIQAASIITRVMDTPFFQEADDGLNACSAWFGDDYKFIMPIGTLAQCIRDMAKAMHDLLPGSKLNFRQFLDQNTWDKLPVDSFVKKQSRLRNGYHN